MSVELKLFRSNRIYRPNEALEGKIITKLSSSIYHHGIRLTVNGSVNLQVRGGSAGVIESFYGVVKPISIVASSLHEGPAIAGSGEGQMYAALSPHAKRKKSIQVASSGRIGSGTTEIPFSMILRHPADDNLEKKYETYHGANISIQYLVTVEILRGYLHKSLSATVEFIIESEKADLPEQAVSPERVIFYITQDTQRHPLLPELKSGGFRVTGKICTQCSLSDPISGELTVEASAVPIQSIDIHLLRVESILVGEKIATETSLIQTTQIADGDVCRSMSLPIYIIPPRLLTCPTIFAGIPIHPVECFEKELEFKNSHINSPFSIEFKLSIVITFQSELSKLHPKSDPRTPRLWLAMESVPLELVRTK